MAEQRGPRSLHYALVQSLKDRGLLTDPRVEAAFRAVPRHLFLPEVSLESVYTDEAIPTRMRDGLAISSSSQPTVMAIMLEQLGLQPGDSVLEIGAGTGYNAALMDHIVGPNGRVVAVDIDQDIVEDARAHLRVAGFVDVMVICRDGALGYPEAAPYDRIILTVSAWDIAAAWVEQLRPGGCIVLPLALRGTVQKLIAFERRDDHLVSVSVQDGAFMSLRGIGAGPRLHVPLGDEPGLVLSFAVPSPADAGYVYGLLTGPYEDVPTQIRATVADLWGGISLWLGLYAPTMCSVVATGNWATQYAVPLPFFASAGFRASIGLLEGTSLCLLARSPESHLSDDEPFGLCVRTFGTASESTLRLVALVRDWVEAGRPSTRDLGITAIMKNTKPTTVPGLLIIDKPRTKLILDWDGPHPSTE